MRVRLLVLASYMSLSAAVHANGGRITWTGERDGRRAAIVVAPVAPRIGLVRVDWIGPGDDAGIVRMVHEAGMSMEAPLLSRGGERHAEFEVLAPGIWTVRLDPDGPGEVEPIEFPMEVGPPIPEWRTQSIWIFSWVPMVAIGMFVAARRRMVPPDQGGSSR